MAACHADLTFGTADCSAFLQVFLFDHLSFTLSGADP
jgi:hypothetical protein